MYMKITILKNLVFLRLFVLFLLFFPPLGSLAQGFTHRFHYPFRSHIESTERENALIEFYCNLRCFLNSFELKSQKFHNNFEYGAKGNPILEQICLSSYDKWFDLCQPYLKSCGSALLFLA